MNVHLVMGASDPAPLWSKATYDTGCVSIVAPPGRGEAMSSLLADMLLQTGRVQPTLVPRPRAAGRADVGRIQVGLVSTGRDVVIHAGNMLAPADAELVALVAHRANVDLWLVGHGDFTQSMRDRMDRWTPTLWTAADAYDTWTARPTSGARAERWPCHAATRLHAPLDPAKGCDAHADAVDCFLAWAAHAVATAAIDERVLRTRAFELTEKADERKWAIFAAARDLHSFAVQAATATGLGPGAQRHLKLRGTAADGSTLTVGGRTYEVPEHLRPVIANHRAVRLADGFGEQLALLLPSDGSLYQFQRSRPGDPEHPKPAAAPTEANTCHEARGLTTIPLGTGPVGHRKEQVQ